MRAAEIRDSIERARAERGAVLTEAEWLAIERNVDSSLPTPDELIQEVVGLLCPVVLPLTPAADTPSTRKHEQPRPRRRRPGRAA